jgi:hypothetical protein
MATDDRFQLDLVGTCLGVNTRNVFFYLQTNGLAEASGPLVEFFISDILQTIRAALTVDMVFSAVNVKNLDNPEDFVDFPLSPVQAGNVDAETLPPFCTFSYRYGRTSLAVRNGAKRFAGVPETYQENGVIVAGTPTTNVVAIATVLDDAISDGAGTTFVPVIMKKTRQPETGPFESWLYEEFAINGVTYSHIGTQNTRKF